MNCEDASTNPSTSDDDATHPVVLYNYLQSDSNNERNKERRLKLTAATARRGIHLTHHDPCGARAQPVNGATPADTARRGGRREDRSTNVPAGHHRLGRSGPGTHGVVVDRAARPAAPYWLSSFVGLRLFSAPTDVAALCLRDRISVTFVHIPPGRGPPAAREPEAVRAHCSPTMTRTGPPWAARSICVAAQY